MILELDLTQDQLAELTEALEGHCIALKRCVEAANTSGKPVVADAHAKAYRRASAVKIKVETAAALITARQHVAARQLEEMERRGGE